MSDDLKLSYEELSEKLQGEIGRRVRQLALQTRITARTANSELRGDYYSPAGMTETIALMAVQDFLDICFDKEPPERG